MPEAILIVDDDESMLELCGAAVRAGGYDVSTAPSGDQALKVLDRRSFDLVLTDLQMPGRTDGHGVVLGVKARTPATEVVVMTAAPTLKTAIATLKDGAYDYIVKPFDPDHLLAVVRRCLDHRRLTRDLSSEQAMRKELESAYKELQKVEQLKEAFLARLSHELKTPMSEFLMALVVLDGAVSQGSPDHDPAQTQRCLQMVQKGARRLEATINELLAFVDLAKQPTLGAAVPVDLEKLCRDALDRLKPLWEPRRLTVSVAFEAGAQSVAGNPALLATAFEHLIHNAIVFNREAGSVTVAGRGRPDACIEIAVADTGEGIPESEFDNIFDSFYQIANYLTRKVEGLGLGLAITRSIVEAHKGDVRVASKVGVGTTFTVVLPRAQASEDPRSRS